MARSRSSLTPTLSSGLRCRRAACVSLVRLVRIFTCAEGRPRLDRWTRVETRVALYEALLLKGVFFSLIAQGVLF